MFRSPGMSWRIGTDQSMILHGALFVRDACRLDHADTFPGPLLFAVPDLSNLVEEAERPEVSGAWGSLVGFSRGRAARHPWTGDAAAGAARPPTGSV